MPNTKRKMADTSLQAFQQKKEEGSLESDKEKVMNLIKELGPITSKELQMWMNKPKHKFSGRITKLQELGAIQSHGKKNGHKQWVKA